MSAVTRHAKPVSISVICLVVVFGLLYSWRTTRGGAVEHQSMLPIAVATIRAEPRNVAEELQAVGSLQAVREVLLAPDTSGRVIAINFQAGQSVKEGAVLVQLYDAPEQADRAEALAKADFAQLQLKRSLTLAATGAEPRELLEQRKAEAAQAAAAVRQLEARIEQKSIRAPFAGQIGIRRINPGQYLTAGDAIATLTQLDPLYVNFTLPQQDLPKLSLGATVGVAVDTAPGQVFSASVSTIEPRIDGQTRNVSVQALLANTQLTLKSGMYVTARLALPATSQAIVLPLTAIQTSASGDSVIVVQGVSGEGVGKAVAVPVTTGRRLGEEVLVTQGVNPGDTVVTAGQNRLPPGAIVKISADSATAGVANHPSPAVACATCAQ